MTPLRGGGEPHKAETASHAQRGRLLITQRTHAFELP